MRDTLDHLARILAIIFSRIAFNMLPRARMVITAIYCRSMSSFYADTEIRSWSHA